MIARKRGERRDIVSRKMESRVEWQKEKREEEREGGFDSVDRPCETPQREREGGRGTEKPLSLSPSLEGTEEGRTD